LGRVFGCLKLREYQIYILIFCKKFVRGSGFVVCVFLGCGENPRFVVVRFICGVGFGGEYLVGGENQILEGDCYFKKKYVYQSKVDVMTNISTYSCGKRFILFGN
jgi:hypothetical protein